MRILVVEDDLVSRTVLTGLLQTYGGCDVAVNGNEAVRAFKLATESGRPYELIFLDIMMPEMDGHDALREIRSLELAQGIATGRGVRVVMTTALSDSKNVMQAFNEQCEGYLVKPIQRAKLDELFGKMHLA